MSESVPVLSVDGTKYDAWTSATVRKSLDEFAHSWSVEYVDKWAPMGDPWSILPGAQGVFYVDDYPIVTGYITRSTWQSDENNYTVTAEGRSETADLVDCAPFFAESDQANNLTLAKMVTSLCDPFSITVVDDSGDTRALKKFTIDLGESAFDAIDKACRSRGVLPMTSPEGWLVLTKAENFSRQVDLPEILLKRRALEYSEENRFSEYFVYGQHPGEETFRGDKIVQQAGQDYDGVVSRYRPSVTIAESPASKADLDAEAAWIRNVRAGRSEVVRYTVAGVLAPDGPPWGPGMFARLNDTILRVRSTLLVQSVTHTWDDSGIWTELVLTRPEAYTTKPFPAKKPGGQW